MGPDRAVRSPGGPVLRGVQRAQVLRAKGAGLRREHHGAGHVCRQLECQRYKDSPRGKY